MPRRSRSGRFTRSARRQTRRAFRKARRYGGRAKPGLTEVLVATSPQIEETIKRKGGLANAMNDPLDTAVLAVDMTTGYNLKAQKFDNTAVAKGLAIKSVKRSIGLVVAKKVVGLSKTGRAVLAWGRRKKFFGLPLWK